VLADLPERRQAAVVVAACTAVELGRVHRHERAAHPEAVCTPEEADEEERR
jgi:hypothetical protein